MCMDRCRYTNHRQDAGVVILQHYNVRSLMIRSCTACNRYPYIKHGVKNIILYKVKSVVSPKCIINSSYWFTKLHYINENIVHGLIKESKMIIKLTYFGVESEMECDVSTCFYMT